MPRLLRPHIPLETRCRVALRQLGEMWPDGFLASRRSVGQSDGNILRNLLDRLASLLGCEAKDLHLDHDPSLGAREKVFRKGEHVGYKPDANDPEHLFYREAAAHRIKTNVRGERGQHPDRVLIKKQRRAERAHGKPDSRKPRAGSTSFRSRVNKSKAKRKWAPRALRSASRWAKGRKIR